MTTINLNDTVRFKLTELGREIYYHRFDKVLPEMPAAIRSYPKVDEDEYSRMQLWEFMATFGPYIGMGKPVPIDPIKLYLEEETENE